MNFTISSSVIDSQPPTEEVEFRQLSARPRHHSKDHGPRHERTLFEQLSLAMTLVRADEAAEATALTEVAGPQLLAVGSRMGLKYIIEGTTGIAKKAAALAEMSQEQRIATEAANTKSLREMFEMFDTDKDEKLSQDEYKTYLEIP
jgi:hypothetical protein